MAKAGLGKLPLLVNGEVAFAHGDKGYFAVAGKAAAHTYVAASYQYDMPDYPDFSARFFAAYGAEPDTWSAGTYACTQVILEAIRQAASSGTLTREAVRLAATKPATELDTELGPVNFNAAGDMLPGPIAIYQADTRLGTWEFVREVSLQVP